jgi:hypothetical protein
MDTYIVEITQIKVLPLEFQDTEGPDLEKIIKFEFLIPKLP